MTKPPRLTARVAGTTTESATDDHPKRRSRPATTNIARPISKHEHEEGLVHPLRLARFFELETAPEQLSIAPYQVQVGHHDGHEARGQVGPRLSIPERPRRGEEHDGLHPNSRALLRKRRLSRLASFARLIPFSSKGRHRSSALFPRPRRRRESRQDAKTPEEGEGRRREPQISRLSSPPHHLLLASWRLGGSPLEGRGAQGPGVAISLGLS